MKYSNLQNGSDIRGVAIAGYNDEAVNLTAEAVADITRGFVLWLCQKKKGVKSYRISVGRDSRLSGEEIAAMVCNELVALGMKVTDGAMATTPAMFMTTVLEKAPFDAAIMITASHLPYNRNGLKFFTAEGGLEKEDIASILALAETTETTGLPVGTKTFGDFITDYAAGLRKMLINAGGSEKPLAGKHIVVDAGNGAGGFYASQVLEPLGADITGSQFLEPDGHFPNHIPNPENQAAMDSIQQAVLKSKADFGIIFDTDVDRAGAVLSSGEELNRNRLIAAISAVLLKEHPCTTIVTDSITSDGLTEFIAAKGGTHHRFRRGYRNVINEALRLNAQGQDTQLAIETSGHAALKENYFLDDGAYLITKLLQEIAKGNSMEELIDGLKDPLESKEIRMPLPKDNFKEIGSKILKELGQYATQQEGWSLVTPNYEGVRVNVDKAHGDGWFLLRLSLHDPILPLNIESNSPGGVEQIQEQIQAFLSKQPEL